MRGAQLGVLLVIIGCGSDSNNNNGNTNIARPTIGTNAGNLCDQIARVACYDMYQCCSEGEIESRLNVRDPRTPTECVDDMKKLCERRLAPQLTSLASNRVQFVATNMDACLDTLLAPEGQCATVDTTLPWTMACMTSPWVGTVQAGGQCFFSYECADKDNNFCAGDQTCKALPTDGMPCAISQNQGQLCASGFYCNNSTCRMQSGAGGQCPYGPQQCMKDLYCDPSTSTPMCQPLKGPGEPCTGAQSCRDGQCIPGTCQGTGQICFTGLQCGGHCSVGGSFCMSDPQCGSGHCSLNTTKTCYSPLDCLSNEGNCVFPVQCIPGNCVGPVVCTTAQLTVDYCSGALNAIP